MLRHTKILGWIVCGKQGIEKTMEFSHAYETDVANFHGLIWTVWTGVPQGMSVVRISKSQLFAKDVVVSHEYALQGRKMIHNAPRGQGYKDGKKVPAVLASSW
jgi:hypothetical protein